MIKLEYMPTFKIRMQGTHQNWPSDWIVGRGIRLLECAFTRTSLDQTQNLSIEVEVIAPSEELATALGKEKISKEFDLFALCAENPLYLDQDRIWTDGA
jgi:hypothetical protein